MADVHPEAVPAVAVSCSIPSTQPVDHLPGNSGDLRSQGSMADHFCSSCIFFLRVHESCLRKQKGLKHGVLRRKFTTSIQPTKANQDESVMM